MYNAERNTNAQDDDQYLSGHLLSGGATLRKAMKKLSAAFSFT